MQGKFHHQFHINSSFDSTFISTLNILFSTFNVINFFNRNNFFCEDGTEVSNTNNLGTKFLSGCYSNL